MPIKKHELDEIIEKLREVEIVLGESGTPPKVCQRIAISSGRKIGDK